MSPTSYQAALPRDTGSIIAQEAEAWQAVGLMQVIISQNYLVDTCESYWYDDFVSIILRRNMAQIQDDVDGYYGDEEDDEDLDISFDDEDEEEDEDEE